MTRPWALVGGFSRFVGEKSPRFTNNRIGVRAIGTYGRLGINLALGRIQTDAQGGNVNNTYGLSLDRRWGRRQTVGLHLEEGTEFVAIVRTARLVEAGYEYLWQDRSFLGGVISIRLKYIWNEVKARSSAATTVQNVILGLAGEF